jgi:glycosyltransferase involved in cell wall biosynthesis
VATDIAGHRGAAIDGVSGLLVESPEAIAPAAIELLGDRARRDALGRGAVGHAAGLSWTAVAALHLELLVSTCTSASG